MLPTATCIKVRKKRFGVSNNSTTKDSKKWPLQSGSTVWYKYLYWASEASPTLGCSIEISRDIHMCVSIVCQIMWNHVNQTRASSKSVLGGKIRPVTPPYYSFQLYARAALVWKEEKSSLRNEKLKANRTS